MKTKTLKRTLIVLLAATGLVPWVAAQRVEINPYAGGILSPRTAEIGVGRFDLKQEGLYGIRAAFPVSPRLGIEGNFGYVNHFKFEDSDIRSRGVLWEASALYHFNLEQVRPFVTAGVGGITAIVDEDEPGFGTGQTPVFGDRDTFFTFSYGGGLKAPRLWGPLGLRGDVRGRTAPNLMGAAVTWLELTGGLTLSF